MRRKLSVVLAVAAVAATMIPGGSAAATPLRWGPCPADASATGLECSTLDVPLDYRQPDGRKIEVAISRLASKNASKRRGVLLTNPGGPGGAGLNFPAALRDAGLPQNVLDAYDVIGMDPRGVGHSTPVTCNWASIPPTENLPPHPRDAADVVKQAEVAKTNAELCGKSETAWMLPFVTTKNTARDMDLIRAALGESKVSYAGYSYGSYLGAVYATMFPERGDRIVLDSNTGPGGLDRAGAHRFAQGFDDRFPDFAKYVAANPQHGLGTTPEQVTAKYFDLAARLDKAPVQGFDGALFRYFTFGSLYSDGQFPVLAESWKALDTDQPLPPGGNPPVTSENLFSSHMHLLCNDSSWPKSVKAYQRDVAVNRVLHPMYGAAAANIRPCAFWPAEPIEPPARIGDRGPANMLLSQNLRDPGTPLAGARELRHALGDRARMVTADQGGHGSYALNKNACLNDTVTSFLMTGQQPARDIACPR